MNSPLVTIGIPTFNRPDGLLNAIKKITSQTYRNIEIIISNNASNNELVPKIIEYCASLDGRIKYCHQQENIGITNNFKYVVLIAIWMPPSLCLQCSIVSFMDYIENLQSNGF